MGAHVCKTDRNPVRTKIEIIYIIYLFIIIKFEYIFELEFNTKVLDKEKPCTGLTFTHTLLRVF